MKKLSIMLFIALSMTTFSFFDKIKSEIQLKLEEIQWTDRQSR